MRRDNEIEGDLGDLGDLGESVCPCVCVCVCTHSLGTPSILKSRVRLCSEPIGP